MTDRGKYEVVIIGGGPAGMSAALWCSDLGLRSVLIEKRGELGGQLSMIHNPIRNYLGLSAANGRDVKARFLRSLEAARFQAEFGRSVIEADIENGRITIDDGTALEANWTIIATGVRRRKLGVEGEDEFYGKGLLASGAKEAEKVKGKHVVIVGGGDAAIENALILSEYASKVTVIHRRNEFRARDEFIDRMMKLPNVAVLTEHAVERIQGGDSVKQLVVRSLRDNSIAALQCDFGLIRIGVQPNSELFGSQLEKDAEGYLKVDRDCRTSVENVYAVGDIANPSSMTIATATGNSATAVSHISKQI